MTKIEKITEAIASERQLTIIYKDETSQTATFTINPLVYGEDWLGLPYLFAYIPHNYVYYKFSVNRIIDTILSNNTFSLPESHYPIYFNRAEETYFVWHSRITLHDGRFPAKGFFKEE